MSSSAAVQAPARRRRAWSLRRREAFWFYVFISPWIIGFLAFQAGPILAAAYFSFTDLTDLNLQHLPQWVGLTEYQRLFTSLAFLQFRDSIKATAIFVVISVPARVIVALLVAQLLNQKIPFLRALRTIYYLPTVVAGVAAALLWVTLLQADNGIVNQALGALHLPRPDWLGNGSTAMGAMITYSGIWYMGTAMVVFLAALQGVPTELYEAAAMDGAGPIRRFVQVSIPMISPVILFVTVVSLIGALQEFVAPAVLTGQGGPADATLLIGLYLYQVAIEYTFPRHGAAASAISMVLFVTALVLTLLIFLLSRRFVFYAGEREGGL
jgi:ABC-type sugar transport system permease subunit